MILEFDFDTEESLGVVEDIKQYRIIQKGSREHSLHYKYKITIEQYEEMFDEQGGRCAICENLPMLEALFVDHCHETSKVRGLLCRHCNSMLGFSKDNQETLLKGADYLRNSIS